MDSLNPSILAILITLFIIPFSLSLIEGIFLTIKTNISILRKAGKLYFLTFANGLFLSSAWELLFGSETVVELTTVMIRIVASLVMYYFIRKELHNIASVILSIINAVFSLYIFTLIAFAFIG